jgi:hypothetical protein
MRDRRWDKGWFQIAESVAYTSTRFLADLEAQNSLL